eukprot:Tamp_29443.p1 GENE.Tamp_29443~~Tamp_29443.p1  ORF type:complete len:129 (-),score=12.30 Tamp_29443:238-624(-)
MTRMSRRVARHVGVHTASPDQDNVDAPGLPPRRCIEPRSPSFCEDAGLLFGRRVLHRRAAALVHQSLGLPASAAARVGALQEHVLRGRRASPRPGLRGYPPPRCLDLTERPCQHIGAIKNKLQNHNNK